MKKISVLVTIKSNKIEAHDTGLIYDVDLNSSNFYTASFRGYIIQELEIPNTVLIEKQADGKLVQVNRNSISDEIVINDGGGSGNVASVTGNLVDNTDPDNPVINLTGTEKDILSFNEDGDPLITPITPELLSDFETPSPFEQAALIYATDPEDPELKKLGWFNVTFEPTPNSLPVYQPDSGTLKAEDGIDGDDLVTKNQLDTKSNFPTVRDQTDIHFDGNQTYGTMSNPLTGNLSLSLTANEGGGAYIPGSIVLIIHNDEAEPTFPIEFKRLNSSKEYVTDIINFITAEILDEDNILYSITQLEDE